MAMKSPGWWNQTARQSRALTIVLTIAFVVSTIAPALARGRAHHASAAKSAGASSLTEPYAEACLMEPVTGTVIFEKNDHQPWRTASLAKMMLMLIVVEKLHDGSLKLTDQITSSRKAVTMGGSQVYLKEGETFSLDDMMKAIVVHSANDASVAVAEYIAGSTDAFVQMMNQQVAALGLKDTHYYSVHGLPPGPGEQPDVSSAYDQAMIARELLKYPQTLQWASIDTAPFRNGTFQLRNTNHLVRTYAGCDGLKTGFYDQAGFNVVATAHRNGFHLIAVVLGSPRKNQNFDEAANLLSNGFVNWKMDFVGRQGEPAGPAIAVRGGVADALRPVWGSDLALFIKRDTPASAVKVAYEIPESVEAPITPGQKLGMAQVTLNEKPAGSAAIVAPTAIAASRSIVHRFMGLF
jgi:D-alanyl-D-alanine carboxypeptidase (penicillin-binding protein 5/6)